MTQGILCTYNGKAYGKTMMETVSYVESFSEPGRVEAWCESDIAEDHFGVAFPRVSVSRYR
nr:hypothetical protein [uncultured Blautia sp.]